MKRSFLLISLACTLAPSLARADDWPSRSALTLVLPSAPGGSSDPLGRLMAEEIGKRIGQTIAVVNRPGAGGNMGMATVARARPDGYTLVMSWTGPLATNLALYKDVGYDPRADFSGIGRIGCTPNVLAVAGNFPANNLKEFMAYSRQQSGKVSYGTTGVGSSWHIAGEMLNRQVDSAITHVPYTSPGATLTDLVAGRLQAIFPVVPMTVPHVKAGTMKVLAVFAKSRSGVLPEAPTTVEQGFPELVSDTCFMLLAPKGTPAPVVAGLNKALNAVLADATLRAKVEAMGIDVQTGAPAAVGDYLNVEIPRQAQLVKLSGAVPQ